MLLGRSDEYFVKFGLWTSTLESHWDCLTAFGAEFLFLFHNLTKQPRACDMVSLASFRRGSQGLWEMLPELLVHRTHDTLGRLGPSWDTPPPPPPRSTPAAEGSSDRQIPWSWSLRLQGLWTLPRTCKSACAFSLPRNPGEKGASTFERASLKGHSGGQTEARWFFSSGTGSGGDWRPRLLTPKPVAFAPNPFAPNSGSK